MPYSAQLSNLLSSLNEYQIAGVNVGAGMACIAGVPGSGKSRTIVARIARLVEDGLNPMYILAMTFTRAAAQEMNIRLKNLGITGARVGTIHSVARQILAAETNLLQEYTLDEKGRLAIELKKCLGEFRKKRLIPQTGVDREGVERYIEACKASGLCYIYSDPFGLNMRSESFMLKQASKWASIAGVQAKKLVDIFIDLERRRGAAGLYDFNDMLLWTWAKLLCDTQTLQHWRNRWSVVIMDECFHANQLVSMVDGTSLAIKRIVDNKLKGPIFSYDSVKQSIVTSTITGWYKIPLKKLLLRITIETECHCYQQTTRPISYLICTSDQGILTAQGWTTARSLLIGDRVIAKNKTITGLIKQSNCSTCCANPKIIAAKVLAIEPWHSRDPYVYDIDVAGTHTFYADDIVVHNCQDSTAIQWDLARFLTGLNSCITEINELPFAPIKNAETHNLMVAGDSSQCLDLNTEIAITASSSKLLKDIQKGEEVLAYTGDGNITKKVLAKGTVKKAVQVELKLKNGVELAGSADHLVFTCFTPSNWYYVYLAEHEQRGYRLLLGTQYSIIPCIETMHSPDRIWLIAANVTKERAQYDRMHLNQKYGISCANFDRQIKQINNNENGLQLLRDTHMLYAFPIWSTQAYVKLHLQLGVSDAIAACIEAKSTRLYSSIWHKKLATIGVNLTLGCDHTGRISHITKDGLEAHVIVQKISAMLLEEGVPSIISTELVFKNEKSKQVYVAQPMAHIQPGMRVRTKEGESIEVTSKKVRNGSFTLADIQVDRVLNFYANGIAVHNSIFAWRAARPETFVDFSKEVNVNKLVLPINYRSKPMICAVATGLVRHKNWHITGEILPDKKEAIESEEQPVTIDMYATPEIEAATVVKKCRELGGETNLRSCAILARLRVSLDLAEIVCIYNRVKYVKLASGSFFDSKEVQDVLAYIRVAAGFDFDGKWMQHIINRPFRYISKAFITKCLNEAQNRGVSLLETLLFYENDLNYAQRKSLRELNQLLRDMHNIAVNSASSTVNKKAHEQKVPNKVVSDEDMLLIAAATGGPAEMMSLMLRKTDYLEEIRREEGLLGMDESKAAGLAALQKMASAFATPGEFLAYVDKLTVAVKQAQKSGLRVTGENNEDALTLSTVHSAKGLEWKHVFVIDVVPGHFPCSKAEDPDEELRLFYVAITRAIDSCHVSYIGDAKMPKLSRSPYINQLETQINTFLHKKKTIA